MDISKKRCFEQQDAGPDACVEKYQFQDNLNGLFPDFFNIKFYDSIQPEKEQIRQDRRLVGNQKQSQYGRGYIKESSAFNPRFHDHDSGIQRTDGIESQLKSGHKAGKKEGDH